MHRRAVLRDELRRRPGRHHRHAGAAGLARRPAADRRGAGRHARRAARGRLAVARAWRTSAVRRASTPATCRRIGRLVADDDGKPPAALRGDRRLAGARTCPPSRARAIVHNDYRIGNVVLAPSRPARIAAVLDWELATIGDPLFDVGYFLASVPEPGEPLTPTEELGTAMLESRLPDPRRAGRALRRAHRRATSPTSTGTPRWRCGSSRCSTSTAAAAPFAGVGDPYYADPALVRSFLRGRPPRRWTCRLPRGRRRGGSDGRAFHDELVAPGATGLPERFFDRFVFNLHRTDATAPSIIFGLGIYPARDIVDGFAILVTGDEQRNVRFSTELSATDGAAAGPFSWRGRRADDDLAPGARPEPDRPGVRPHLAGAHAGLVRRRGGHQRRRPDHVVRAPLPVRALRRARSPSTGAGQRIDGWYGQRDRSRGVRTMAGGQGLHIWYQAQFPDRSVGFLLVEDRARRPAAARGRGDARPTAASTRSSTSATT